MSHEQLQLPLSFSSAPSEGLRIPRNRRVFVNRNLKLSLIDWIGFDMDYTLAIYNQIEMDRLSIRATLEKLAERGYPQKVLRNSDCRIEFPIRGLLIDKRYGHILKMDRFKVVQRGYHGFRELTKDELRELYQHRKIRPTTARYHWIDTLYALSEAALYAGIVDAYEGLSAPLDYARLFTDIRESIDEAHRDGTILNEVERDLPRYVDRDPQLAQTLHKLRSAGKKLFLLTNSRWAFSEKMMTYLLGDAMPEYPSFRHYFDVIVVAAKKPAFFQERRPLLVRDGTQTRTAALNGSVERGATYEGGNLADFEKLLGVTGDRVLYVGDHIYGDILRSKKESAWRTAMIIQEMEAEVMAHEACREQLVRGAELEERRDKLEDQLRYYQQGYKDLMRRQEAQAGGNAYIEAERSRIKRIVDRVRSQLRGVDAEATAIDREIAGQFHKYWGSLLKETSETSSFGDQVEEYACIYTSRVSNLLAYSPVQFFRSPRDLMPHEL